MRYAIVGRTVNDAFADSVTGNYDAKANTVALQLGKDRLAVEVLGPKVAGKFDTARDLKPIVDQYPAFFRPGRGAAANVERSLWESAGSGIETHLIDESGSDSFLGGSQRYSSLEAYDRPWHIIYPDGSGRTVIRQRVSGNPKLAYLEQGLREAEVIVLTKTHSKDVTRAVIAFANDSGKRLYVGGINNDAQIAQDAVALATTVFNLEEQLQLRGTKIPKDYDGVLDASKSLLAKMTLGANPTFVSAGAYGNGGSFMYKGEPWFFHITPKERISKATSEYAQQNPLNTNGMGDDLLAKHALLAERSRGVQLNGDLAELARSGMDLLERMGLGDERLWPLQNAYIASMALSKRLGYDGSFDHDDFDIDAAPLKK